MSKQDNPQTPVGEDLPARIYVDNALVSRFTDPLKGKDFSISDADAEAILKICSSKVELVTSDETLNEVLDATDLKQRAMLVLITTLATRVPSQPTMHSLSGSIGSMAVGATPIGGGGVYVDPLLSALWGIFDQGDAKHVFQAIKNDCSYFVTLDQKTIVARAKEKSVELSRICPNLKFVTPTELAGLWE
jgi:predicted nucleic acid-binding protein